MIIGVHGESRSGKDSIANIITSHYPQFNRWAFADPLRTVLLGIIRALNPELAEMVDDQGWDALKADFPELVDAMIALGAGMREHVFGDVWLHGCPLHMDLVIPDVRHTNEATMVQINGGLLWKVIRPGTKPRAMDSLLADWGQWDAIIMNDGDLDDLEKQVLGILELQCDF